jgi:hypothetical protein
VEYLNNVGSIKNDGICAREIKSRIAWQKRRKKTRENANVNSFKYKRLFLYCTQMNTTGKRKGFSFLSHLQLIFPRSKTDAKTSVKLNISTFFDLFDQYRFGCCPLPVVNRYI